MISALDMNQYRLVQLIGQFLESAQYMTLLISVWRRERNLVLDALVYFLADFASPRYTSVMCSWRDLAELDRVVVTFDAQQSEYMAGLHDVGFVSYRRDVLRIAEPPQQAFPDYVRHSHHLQFKRRSRFDLAASTQELALYNDLTPYELHLVTRLRPANKRICVMYNSEPTQLAISTSSSSSPQTLLPMMTERELSERDTSVYWYRADLGKREGAQ